MGTQLRNASHATSPESIMLGKQARKELTQSGQTTVICPECKKSPKLTTTARGERTSVFCECGYIFYAEINF